MRDKKRMLTAVFVVAVVGLGIVSLLLQMKPTSVLVLGDSVGSSSIHDRKDLQRRELPLTLARVSLDGESKLLADQNSPAVSVLPPAQSWAYGVVIHLDPNEMFNGIQWIVLEFAQLKGTFGAGVLNKVGSDFQKRIEVEKSNTPVEVWLRISDPTDVSAAVVQNWDKPNTDSAILVKAWLVHD
jgi:hypothetical protein